MSVPPDDVDLDLEKVYTIAERSEGEVVAD
jgi:hypothetical protein